MKSPKAMYAHADAVSLFLIGMARRPYTQFQSTRTMYDSDGICSVSTKPSNVVNSARVPEIPVVLSTSATSSRRPPTSSTSLTCSIAT